MPGVSGVRGTSRGQRKKGAVQESAQQAELAPRYGMPTLASSLAHSSELGLYQGTQAGLLLIRHTSATCCILQALWTTPPFDLCWTGRDRWAEHSTGTQGGSWKVPLQGDTAS